MRSIRAWIVTFLLCTGAAQSAAGQQTQGAIAGAIIDSSTAANMRGVTIEVEGMPDKTTQTDTDGAFRILLPPGAYKVRLKAANYFDRGPVDVVVMAGRTTEYIDVMVNTASKGTEITVTTELDAGATTAQALLVERKLASVVSDSISREEIRGTIASDAAGAVEKVTGVSIVDDGYVYVRGLGERYSATMLNDAMVPTTDPERRVVPLDLFPSSLIDSIKILKSYSPDLPGEFSGGLVQMKTIEFPRQRTLVVGYSSGFNTNTTFKDFMTYGGGGRDFFGFDDGTRDIPAAIPDERLFPGSFSQDQFQTFGRAFSNNWEPTSTSSIRPGQTISISGGDSWGKFGLVGALTFSNKPDTRREIQQYLRKAGNSTEVHTTYPDFETASETSRTGLVLNGAFRASNNHKFVLRNTWTHDSEKEARRFEGLNEDIVKQATRLRWIERGIRSTGLEGEHAVPQLGNSLFKWQVTYSQSKRDEPDLRETIRGRDEEGRYSFLALPESGIRFFNKMEDRIWEPLVEWSIPFYTGRISGLMKAGVRGTYRERDFEARRFRFLPQRVDTLDFYLPTNELLSAPNIRPDAFQIRENTRGTDQFDATMDTNAAFVMGDIALGSKFRVIGGVRWEDSKIRVNTIDPLVPGAIPSVASLDNRDYLPGINVVYTLTSNQNLRFGYGRTVSRPDFRELSPFDFNNVLGGFTTAGNPNLKRALIDNYDARWEWFPGGNQIIAVSYFLKDFTDPIEVQIQPTLDQRQSFINAAAARNQGIEVEFRRDLGFLSDGLRQFSIQFNGTFVDSNVELSEEQALLATSLQRPLVGQSRFIFNAITEWTKPEWRSQARFFVNSVSKRITEVGASGLPDIYQQRNTLLDFVYQYELATESRWNLRFTAENLGNNQFRWIQADTLHRSYYTGRTFAIGTTFSIF